MAEPHLPKQDLSRLLVELRRVDALLHERTRWLREQGSLDPGEIPGLFITDREFEELLSRPFGASSHDAPALSRDANRPTGPSFTTSRWDYLLHAFALSPMEGDVLLLCLLPEIDLKYERIFAFLQDDVTRKRPGVDLIIRLLCSDLTTRLRARTIFDARAPLMRSCLLNSETHKDSGASLLAQTLYVDPTVSAFLLDPDPERLEQIGVASLEVPTADDARPALGLELLQEIEGLSQGAFSPGLWVHLIGEDAWTAHQCARSLSWAWGLALLRVEVPPDVDMAWARQSARQVRRDSLLRGAALHMDLNTRQGENGTPSDSIARQWMELFQEHPLPVFWSGREDSSMLAPALVHGQVLRLRFAPPDYGRRRALWELALGDANLSDSVELETVAGRYRLSGQQIEDASRAARHAAWQRDPVAPVVSPRDLTGSARAVSSIKLGQLAKSIEPRHDWGDLILPDDRLAQLHEMCDQFRYRPVVYDRWGFGRRASLGRGLSALFAGPSGTGKTMAAEIIANELELDLFKIDLSGVVSKYIGETEKNLERIFTLARNSNAILLFDEADSLFGKRSETKDAHDRYANIEISYLLQKVEEYDGVVILTSNLRKNLDEAFLRRLHFTVEFPLPDEVARLQIWRRTLPDEAPLGDDVDLTSLATRFTISGGNIRNALVNAAFLAARDGQVIDMQDLLWAVRREFQKLGKLVDESQFMAAPGD